MHANKGSNFTADEKIYSVDSGLMPISKLELLCPHGQSLSDNVFICGKFTSIPSEIIRKKTCKRLHDLGKISNFYISSGTIKVKISENRNPISITHTQDFVKYFPKVDLLPTSQYSYCTKLVLMETL